MLLLNYHKSHYLVIGMLLLLLFVVTACGGAQDTNSNGNTNATVPTSAASDATPTTAAGSTQASAPTSVAITPSSASGSAGTGPVVIDTPTLVAGGAASSQQITLSDRQLIITSVTRQSADAAGSTTITLVLMVKNTSGKTIKNQADFFQLMGAEGDAFGQANSSDNFYGTIQSHAARNGTIIFRLPTAAATKVRLLYRSEIASETVITDLNV